MQKRARNRFASVRMSMSENISARQQTLFKWRMIRSRKARIRVAVVAYRRGTSSTHLVKVSKETRSVEFPSLERGSGPTKLAHIMPKGSLTCLVSIFPACYRCSDLYFWHVIH